MATASLCCSLTNRGPGVAACMRTGSFLWTGLDFRDRGPLGNLLRIPLPSGSSGNMYLTQLREHALAFLLSKGGGRQSDEVGGEADDVLWAAHVVQFICAG